MVERVVLVDLAFGPLLPDVTLEEVTQIHVIVDDQDAHCSLKRDLHLRQVIAVLRDMGLERSPVAAARPVLDPLAEDRDVREAIGIADALRSEEHTSELQSQSNLVCRLLLEKKRAHQ